MAIRAFPYDSNNREAFNRVRSRVYRGGDPVREDEDLMPSDSSGTLVELDGSIVGAATSLHFDCSVRGGRLKSAGVAAVGVLPEARRSGAGSELMRGVNRQMRDEGFALALLYPYSARFYRQFGYEYAGNRLTIKCPSSRLPDSSSSLPVREAALEDWRAIVPCYELFAKRYGGMNFRNDAQWLRALGADKPFTIFVAGDPIEAYALVRLEWTFWIDQVVREFVWSTPRGYASILGFLKGLGANKNSVAWLEPSESPWLMQFGERDVEVTANQQIMWRVLNVPAALSVLRSARNEPFSFELIDSSLPENDGCWSVAPSAEDCRVERGREPAFSLDIRAFSQALLGEPSLEQLARSGRIDVRNSEGFERAAEAMPAVSGFCLEYF